MATQTTTPLLAWRAPAKAIRHRSARWYLVGGIACAMAVAYGVLSGAWSLSVTFGMIGGLYLLTRNETPRIQEIRLSPLGLGIDETFIPWAECKEFWILQDGLTGELHIARQANWRSNVVLQTGDVDLYELRDVLSAFIPQNPHGKESILDTIIRFCKL